MEQAKVKVHYFNDPSKIKYVTKDAVPLVAPKWVVAKDQTGVQAIVQKKTQPVAAVVAEDPKKIESLRAEYATLTGKEADPAWSLGKLLIETHTEKMKKETAAQQAEPVADSEPVKENTDTEKGAPAAKPKKEKKAKATETPAE